MSFPGLSRHPTLFTHPPQLPENIPVGTLLAVFNPFESIPTITNAILLKNNQFKFDNKPEILDIPANNILSDQRWITTREFYTKFTEASISILSPINTLIPTEPSVVGKSKVDGDGNGTK